MKKTNKKGFTLAELLIVVAIIAVLVAIAIPVFTSRLEQSRETTDLANLRSAYAAGQVAAMNGINGSKITENTVYFFNPNASEGLDENKASGLSGQGTAVDGKTSVSGLASAISYNTTHDVRTSVIAVQLGTSGLVSVSFSAAS